MGVNALFYVAAAIDQQLVVSTFGLTPSEFLNEPWTIVTNMFVHAGIWHILSNMLILYFFGSFLLGLVGEKKFLIIYFVGGLLGNLLFMWLALPFQTAVGASGALYAVMGTLAVMRPRMKVLVYFLIPVDLWIIVIVGALMILPGIAWQAHLGGLALGLAAGLYLRDGLTEALHRARCRLLLTGE